MPEPQQVTGPDGATISYDEIGDASGSPLLLVNGLGATSLGWHHELCGRLAEAGFRVIRMDNRDVGLSQRRPGESYTMHDFAADTVALLDVLGIDAVHLVGQSMGGMIVQHVAALNPERVRTLTLVYTAADARHFLGQDVVDERLDSPFDSRESFIRWYVKGEEACASPAFARDLDWLAELGGQMYDRGYDLEGPERQFHATLASVPFVDLLDRIVAPTLIMAGDSDRMIASTGSEELHERIKDSRLVVFPGVGHEIPRVLWDYVVGLLADHAGVAAR